MQPLTREERLVILIEECGEVIQAATKCLRFGWDRDQPEYGVNHEVLAREVGDLLGMIDSLQIDGALIDVHRRRKLDKATRIKAMLCPTSASQ